MGLFEKPEVVILKESSDAKNYLIRLEELQKTVQDGSELSRIIGKEIMLTKAGIVGEDQIMFELKNSGMDLVVLHDIYIEEPSGNGAQIDFLVITSYVSVIIECKNLVGTIEINNKGEFIRTFKYGNRSYKEGIYSPVTQNERHIRVYKECRKASKGVILSLLVDKFFDRYNKSLVVLANPKTIVNDRYAPAEIKNQVIRCDQLITTLSKMTSDNKNSKQDMRSLGETILAMNIEDRKDYYSRFAKLQEETLAGMENDMDPEEEDHNDDTSEEGDDNSGKKCPRCGKDLVMRTAKKGKAAGTQFWGCSGFPGCRYIENVAKEKGDEKCCTGSGICTGSGHPQEMRRVERSTDVLLQRL